MAMGAFLLLAIDDRIGAEGPYKIAANEVAIGMTMPYTAIELMRLRLSPTALQRSAVLAETFDPAGAISAGYLDRTVAPNDVVTTAQQRAGDHLGLDARAHRDTKLRLRQPALDAIRVAIERDQSELGRRFT
jgi:enoyl-CoA hydratase